MTVYKVVLAAPTGSIHLVQYTENAPHLIYLYESGITTTTTTVIQNCYQLLGDEAYITINSTSEGWCADTSKVAHIMSADTNSVTTATKIYSGTDCLTYADAGYYGLWQSGNWRYWNGTAFTGSGTCPAPTTTTTTTSPFATSYLIYNFHAVVDSKNITALGWSIPSKTTYENLISHLGGYAASLAKLKSTTSWSTPGNNSSGFDAKSNGGCNYSPSYTYGQGSFMLNWTTTAYDSTHAWHFGIQNDSAWLEAVGILKWIGGTIRAYRSTANPDGTLGVYNGNDGKAYQTVAIGGIEITTQDLEETKFRDNSLIPYISDGTIWYNNGTPCSTYYGGLS